MPFWADARDALRADVAVPRRRTAASELRDMLIMDTALLLMGDPP